MIHWQLAESYTRFIIRPSVDVEGLYIFIYTAVRKTFETLLFRSVWLPSPPPHLLFTSRLTSCYLLWFLFFLPLICLHHMGNSLFKTEINTALQWGMGSKHKHFQEMCVFFCAVKIPPMLDRKGVLFSLQIMFFCDCLPICPLNPLCLCVELLMHSRTCFHLNIS